MSKFKIASRPKGPPVEKPATRAEFVAGASMVQSQASSRPPKPIRLNLDLEPDLHRRLKLRAVESGTTIAHLVRDLITRELG